MSTSYRRKTGKCIDCGKRVWRKAKRCRKCFYESRRKHTYCIDCGKEVSKSHVKRCLKCHREYQKVPENNPMFGKLRLDMQKENNSQWNSVLIKCPICKKEFYCNNYKIKICKTKICCSLKCSYILKSFVYKGNGNGNWKGGIAFEPYDSSWNNKLKESIRKRDNYKCQLCGIKQEDYYRKLDVHHIDYDKKNCKKDNLITLCLNCHSRTNGNREYWKEYFNKKVIT